jgi:hypothetical protein
MLDAMGREEMRAADADRHAVADELRTALDEGRLDLHEYDERLQRAYAAKTYGELDLLLIDLPNVAVPSAAAVSPVKRDEHVTAQWLAHTWSGWGSTAAITTTIWLVASLAATDLLYFWPIWVAGPWGLVLLWRTIGGLASGEPQKLADARERKELAKQRKRERKALEAEAIARGELPAKPGTTELPPKPAKTEDAKSGAGKTPGTEAVGSTSAAVAPEPPEAEEAAD